MINRRWVEYGPPNYPFVLNRESPQAKGLVAWFTAIASRGSATLRNLATGLGPSDGAVNFATASWVNAANEPALSISGNFGLNFGTNIEFPNQSYSFVFRADLLSLPTSNSVALLSKRQTGGAAGWRFGFLTSNRIRLSHNGATPEDYNYNGPALLTGVHSYVIIYNNDSNTVLFYRDGQLQDSGSLGSQISASTTSLTMSYSVSDDPIKILSLSFYNRILTPVEIYQLYAPQTRWELYQPIQRDAFAFVAAAGLGPVYPGRNHPSRNVSLRL